MTTQLYNGFIAEVANRIYNHVVAEQLEAGRNQDIEPDFGLASGWVEARIDVETRTIFDKGDYLTPDYVEVRYDSIYLHSGAAIHQNIDDEGELIERDSIMAINRELAKLCA